MKCQVKKYDDAEIQAGKCERYEDLLIINLTMIVRYIFYKRIPV